MDATIDEIASGIYRISTWVDAIGPNGFTFNQFLIDAEEPFLFHTGHPSMYAATSAAVDAVVGLDRLRWIGLSHYEADECGAMNQFLDASRSAEVAAGALACMVSLNEMAARPPRMLGPDEVVDLGGKRVRHIDTPHVPHSWDAGLLYEETTGTLFSSDLLTNLGRPAALVETDIVEPAMEAERLFHPTSLTPNTAPTIRRLAALAPTTIAVMHGSSFAGDGGATLNALADFYEQELVTAQQLA